MKEIKPGLDRLTRTPAASTLRSDRSFMAEPSEGLKPPKTSVSSEKSHETAGRSNPLWLREGIVEARRQALQDKIMQKNLPEGETPGMMLAKEHGADWEKMDIGLRGIFDQQARELGPSLGAMNVNVLDPNLYADPGLQSVVRRISAGAGGPSLMDTRMEEIKRRLEAGTLNQNDVNNAELLLNTLEQAQLQRMRATAEERFGLYLQREDIRVLRDEGPIKWLDDQFDLLYRSVREGQELTSPVISNLQTVVSEAIRWLQYYDPTELERFQNLFIQRLNLMTMRALIGYRSIGSVKEAAIKLRSHGLIAGFGMEGGKVANMFNRLNELLDDQRLKSSTSSVEFGHVTPAMANQLQENVINEQLGLAVKNLGDFLPRDTNGNIRPWTALSDVEQTKVKADIVRATRIAYDVFVDSQRQAIVVARGRHLTTTDAYFSDPSSGPLNVYNLEDLLTEKFDIFNRPDYDELERIKLDIAESHLRKHKPDHPLSHQEKIHLGTRLFRDLFAVPDFFSSGWRIKGILDSIEERFVARYGDNAQAREKAKDMALFLRLKGAGTSEPWQITRQQAWEKIAKFRPEEIVRLFRERSKGVSEFENRLAHLFSNPVFARNGVRNYDEFKEKYGVVLRTLRDRGYKDFRQINIAQGLSQEEANLVNTFFNSNAAAAELREMFVAMTAFSNASINNLLKNNKFEDIYTRTINVEDAMLDELEKTTSRFGGKFVPLSEKYAADQGGDALVRNWNDTENAIKAAGALIKFVKSEDEKEKLKEALEFAEANSQYNAQIGRAKALRFTYGTFLLTSKKDFQWDVIGLDKLPFRASMSDIERIRGISQKPLSRDEIRAKIDHISSLLEGSISKDAREGRKTPAEVKKELEDVKEFEKDLVVRSENTWRDYVKRKSLSVLLYLLLFLLGEGQRVLRESGKGALAKAA